MTYPRIMQGGSSDAPWPYVMTQANEPIATGQQSDYGIAVLICGDAAHGPTITAAHRAEACAEWRRRYPVAQASSRPWVMRADSAARVGV